MLHYNFYYTKTDQSIVYQNEEHKQKISNGFNLSKITFLHEPTNEEPDIADYVITAMSRRTFAGHPTTGTSIYVGTHAAANPNVKRLHTLAGIIPFERDEKLDTTTVAIPHDMHIREARLPHPFPQSATDGSSSDTVPLVFMVKDMAFNLIFMADLPALSLFQSKAFFLSLPEST